MMLYCDKIVSLGYSNSSLLLLLFTLRLKKKNNKELCMNNIVVNRNFAEKYCIFSFLLHGEEKVP